MNFLAILERQGKPSHVVATGLALAGACAWLWADIATGHEYSYPLIRIWNTFIRLGFFVVITLLLSALKRATERDSKNAVRYSTYAG